jgi:hypothetical protein
MNQFPELIHSHLNAVADESVVPLVSYVLGLVEMLIDLWVGVGIAGQTGEVDFIMCVTGSEMRICPMTLAGCGGSVTVHQYFPMVLKGSNGGSGVSVHSLFCSFSIGMPQFSSELVQ